MKQKLSFLLSALMCVFGTSAWALEKDADGIYQIGTAEDLVAFSELVNGGEFSANAVLTADIDMSGITMEPIGLWGGVNEDGNIGFSGTFDGQGHVISNFTIEKDDKYVGLFSILNGGAVVKNFVMQNANISGKAFVGIIGGTNGTEGSILVDRLGIEGNISGTANCVAGIIGLKYDGDVAVDISNCFVAGKVSGKEKSAAITGYAGNSKTRIENCWSIAELEGFQGENYMYRGAPASINNYSTLGQVTVITDEQIASGELCYLLNGDQNEISWYQTIGLDAHPVFSATHGIVYTTAEKRCDGKVVGEGIYTNDVNQVSEIPNHKYKNGVCTVCGQEQEGFMEPDADGYYNISNGEQLAWFASAVNNGNHAINARLTADIDMTGITMEPIGLWGGVSEDGNIGFSGTFDGQGHVISNFTIEKDDKYVGLFSILNGGAVVKNFVMQNANISGKAFVGIIGGTNGTEGSILVDRLGIEGNISGTANCVAGIIGLKYDGDVAVDISNCFVAGKVSGKEKSAAITGYAGNSKTRIENCWSIAELEGFQGENYMYRGAPASINNYSTLGQVTVITDEQIASGELCYLLNGDQSEIAWYQNIGEDPHPVFDPSHQTVIKNEDGSYDNITAIETVQSEESKAQSDIYDLSGRKISGTKLSKGIYIINGKKVAIK